MSFNERAFNWNLQSSHLYTRQEGLALFGQQLDVDAVALVLHDISHPVGLHVSAFGSRRE